MIAALLPSLFKVLRIQIGLPLVVILVVGLWATFDKKSAVRRAVDAQADQLLSWVAQEQIAEIERRRVVAVGALKAFRDRAHEADARAIEAERQIEEYTNGKDIHPSCIVGPDLFERLR